MPADHLIIKIEHEEVSDLYAHITGLIVDTGEEGASSFRLTLAILRQQDGSWLHLDDSRLRPWAKIEIEAGFDEVTELIFSGYITHIHPQFEPNELDCRLEISGRDNSVIMDRQEVMKEWPNRKDSDIAREIIDSYALNPEVEETSIVYEEEVATIIQRGTDWQFLTKLALRNGFELYVEGDDVYFRPAILEQSPQPLLSVHAGSETTVSSFSVEVDALLPTKVAMTQIDWIGKEVFETLVEESQEAILGGQPASELSGSGVPPAMIHAHTKVSNTLAEMNDYAGSIYRQADWFVRGQGEILSAVYGHVLKPHRPVTIRGIGEPYSGIYQVTHVTHHYQVGVYTQQFRVKRNGLYLSGREDFSGSNGNLFGL